MTEEILTTGKMNSPIPINTDPEVRKLAEELFLLKKKEKEDRERMKFLSDSLKKGVNEKTTRIGPYLFKKSKRKGNVDYKKIPELKRVDIDQYRREETIAWTLTQVE